MDIFGYAIFDEEQSVHTLNSGCDDEIAIVTAGKEFGLLKTVSGKVGFVCVNNFQRLLFNHWYMPSIALCIICFILKLRCVL